MEIAQAREDEIGEIVALLKDSLGESLMPKSVGYWRWKHLDNPFGSSPVLLCREHGKLIGVRAFMRWQWRHGEQVYRAVRAVDTATHPQHQGKGIFKKLTLSLVDSCTREGDDFVFNTPNSQSKPGYLKMAWEEAGKLPIAVSVQRPFSILKNLLSPANAQPSENNEIKQYLSHPGLEKLLQESQRNQKYIATDVTVAYLQWRYLNVPVARYVAVGLEEHGDLTGLIIGRLKPSRLGVELRITNSFVTDTCDIRLLRKKLRDSKKSWGVDYTTYSGTSVAEAERKLRGMTINVQAGPTVTIRRLALQDLGALTGFKQWSPALGDLELF